MPNMQIETSSRRSHGLCDDVLLLEVLTWLPAKLLSRFKLVSRLWRDTISGDRLFALLQSRRQTSISSGLVYCFSRERSLSFFPTFGDSVGVPDPSLGLPNPKSLKLAACVHGLLLLQVYLASGQFLYICNPATGEGRRIPGGMRGGYYSSFGLAFDPSASPDRFTLINAQRSLHRYKFEIFSSSTGQWTASSAKPIEMDTAWMPSKAVFAGGVVYWHCIEKILSYDTLEDATHVMMVPPGTSNNCVDEIGVLEERLTCTRQIGDIIQVWVMRKKKSRWEWEMRHHIPLDRIYNVRPRLFAEQWCKFWVVAPISYEGGENIYMRARVKVAAGEVEVKDVIMKWDMEAEEAAVLGEIDSVWCDRSLVCSYHNSLAALPRLPNIE